MQNKLIRLKNDRIIKHRSAISNGQVNILLSIRKIENITMINLDYNHLWLEGANAFMYTLSYVDLVIMPRRIKTFKLEWCS
ncbi:MAG: hypothetical protein DRN30_04625 [Thermoplasmata archaeon]|nr:MAG: hypothetical protein DRN30_04625 [Thermoplasmata archaeon]